MAWRPIRENHAIERVRVICAFQAEIRPKFLQRLSEFIERKRGDFELDPVREIKGQGLVIEMGPGGAINPRQNPSQIRGWAFSRRLPTGDIIENIGLENGVLTYEISEYSRWNGFHERMLRLIEDVVFEMSTYDDMSALSLEYYDRFVFEGKEIADPRAIFKMGHNMVPETSLDAGNLWHIHRGWFEDTLNGKILVNQNIDAQDGEFLGTPARSLSLLTKIEARSNFVQLSPASLRELLPSMHEHSNSVFKNILNSRALEMIGMEQ